ncbi:FG-GAP-like repeat-containing protein [Tamlana flava]|uniref:FG-GAP-like repeat-containing protein n=1 Tax=Tamlana flava TaxID=3158572 RepID=UPI00351AB852
MSKIIFRSYFSLFIVSLILACSNTINAQTFEHIESFAGLSSLEENNGVAIADYDQDGDLDIFVVAKALDADGVSNSKSRLFSNNNDGTFTDMTEISGLVNLYPYNSSIMESEALLGFKYGAFWGDYDNDGYPDLFMTHLYRLQLFHNERDGSFKKVAFEISSFGQGCANTDVTWFDYNNDGFLDIYLSEWEINCTGNRLYKNNGDGTFTNVSNLFPRGSVNKRSYQSIPFDFNNDGWMDLYVANDNYPNNLLINNEGGGFVEIAYELGMAHDRNDMGMAFGDYNNDGFFDLFITTIRYNVLYENNGDNTFVDKARALGVNSTDWAWDTNFSDFDLDRDEDLYIVNGFYSIYKNRYFENLLNQNELGFMDSSQKTGLGELTVSVGAGIFDYDNDGDLDIFLSNNDRPSYFYENKINDFTNPKEDLHWFKIKLEGTVSNRDAIGTKVSIRTTSGWLHRYFTGKGFLSQNLVPVHFGLGSDSEVLELKISWPSGIIDTYYDIPANKLIKSREGESFEIVDQAPSIKPYGCTNPNSCNYNPNAVVSTGACVYLQTSNITGKIRTLKNSIELYTYPLKDRNTLEWQVTGGQIVNTQGDDGIVVQWGTGETGKITLLESNGICSSEPLELVVTLLDEESSANEHSVARLWNETLLSLIRKDYARPTVHARNLFHTGIAMYDAWAIYDSKASPYLISNEVHGFQSGFQGFSTTEDISEARNKTISYAAYRLLSERFSQSPSPALSKSILDVAMAGLGYDTAYESIDYSSGDPRALGNYIAAEIIAYGLQDNSNEAGHYQNEYYEPVNQPLVLNNPDVNDITQIDPNRWQPLSFDTFIDQSGNVIEGKTPAFLSPEWGNVYPFSLTEEERTTYTRDGDVYQVYHDPGAPPTVSSDDYKWAFSMVSKWSSQLDPMDGVIWDISPKSIGNIKFDQLPSQFSDYKKFYKEAGGGDIGTGRPVNPYTQAPYDEQLVPRGDYARVLAEFWADGPDSETPPGHWFTILNYVNDHELFTKRFQGQGDILPDLEWDVKAYFILGGTMHDVAITSWAIKGWYDYIRPISAIRYMCAKGQCTDPLGAHYDPSGIPLKPGYIEIIGAGDPLAGESNKNVGKIKLYSWKGHDYIIDPAVDEAGVGWILAEDWWPYQRPSFVTPPFAGYVSGHSTYSRAAAVVMSLLTGDEYFPGGMGEFVAKKNEFLVFEEGPSMDVILQWATYRDASDQCSLSRIWGGIHPPLDDIPGRIIGEEIGKEAYDFGVRYFEGLESPTEINGAEVKVYPNPVGRSSKELFLTGTTLEDAIHLFDMNGRLLEVLSRDYNQGNRTTKLLLPPAMTTGMYLLKVNNQSRKVIVVSK